MRQFYFKELFIPKWNIACGLVIFLSWSQASIFPNCQHWVCDNKLSRLFSHVLHIKLSLATRHKTTQKCFLYLCSVCFGCRLVLEYFLDGLKWFLKFSILRLLRWKFSEFCRLTLRSNSSGGKSSNLASGKGWYLQDKLYFTDPDLVLHNFKLDFVT